MVASMFNRIQYAARLKIHTLCGVQVKSFTESTRKRVRYNSLSRHKFALPFASFAAVATVQVHQLIGRGRRPTRDILQSAV